MQFDEVILKRQTIRSYTKKEISIDELDKIVEAGRLAPSAKNRQPWRFYYLNDEQKNYIVNKMYEWEKNNRNEKTSVKGSADQMKEANKVIMIYYPLYKCKWKNIYYKKVDYLSLGAAIENMSLKCTEMGLGSCWCADTLYIDKEIDEYLGIHGYEQISALMIGYPKKVLPKRKKKTVQELKMN